MEAIGEKLRSAREQLGKSIEEIARETNITKRFIIALENEDFSAFPGEPYLIGFLRTYSESLGLSPDELVALYKNFKIQEQPLPMDELIQKPHRRPFWLIPLAIVLLGGIGTGIYFLIPVIRANSAERRIARTEKAASEVRVQGTVYDMKNEMIERRFVQGDIIQVPVGPEIYSLRLSSVGERLTVSTDEYDLNLSVGEEVVLDLNTDNQDDIKIYVQDIDVQGDEKAAVVRFDRFTQAAVAAAGSGELEETGDLFITEEPAEAAEASFPGEEESLPVIGATTVTARRSAATVVKEVSEKEALTMDIIFRGYCLLRYLVDENRREERYFHKGETFRLEANNKIRLWISNAGALKAKVAGVDIDLGRPGEVVTNLITWEEDSDTDQWKLTVVPVY